MKLELKHLAPYLPYGLKGKTYFLGEHNIYQISTDNVRSCIGKNASIKPILRPLSDLTKEIEVNGEKFVPYKKLDWGYCNGDAEFGNVVYCAYGESPKTAINVLDYINDYFQLLQWHFDVFGLIEQGLAIDINTLND